MSSLVYMRNKKNGRTYVYSNESVWDPDRKRAITKRKCIGHLDPDTGEVVENTRKRAAETVTVKSEALTMICDKISEELGLTHILSIAFPKEWKLILSLAYYIVSSGNELIFSRQWSERNRTPYNKPITMAAINEMLGSLSPNSMSMFFTMWADPSKSENVYVDNINLYYLPISIVEYSKILGFDISDVRYGMRMELYYDAKTNIPVSYCLYNASSGRPVYDSSVRSGQFKNMTVIRDELKGDEVDPEMFRNGGLNATVRLLAGNELVRETVEKAKEGMESSANFRDFMGYSMFFKTFLRHEANRRYYCHVYLDPNKVSSDMPVLLSIMDRYWRELETGNLVEAHRGIYNRFFIINEVRGKKVVEFNGETMMDLNPSSGYFAIMSNVARTPESAINPFVMHNLVARMYDNIVNEYDNVVLNLNGEVYYRARIFLQFIALVIRMGGEKIMNGNRRTRVMSFKQVIYEVRNIQTVRFPGVRKPQYTTLNPVQETILEVFGIELGAEKPR